MMYALGILTGILLMGFTFLALLLMRTPLERTLNQFQSKLKTKGTIIEPEPEELNTWIETLKHEV